jgi:arginine decarboxylase
VLVFDTLGATGLDQFRVPARDQIDNGTEDDETPQVIRDLYEAYESVSERLLMECYHDAVQARESAQYLFSLGYLSLEHRALADQLFWGTCGRVRDISRKLPEVPEELADLETILCQTYFCNFSVFQSLPDSWAIGQLFPIMPIHRLDEEPTRRAVLADITCDSDGKIDRFVDVRDVNRTLPLHALREGEPYYLAAFLVGAYQETLGDLHNLFGDTHVVHLSLHEEGGWWIDEKVRGDSAADVLRYVQFDPKQLQPRMSRDCERAVRAGRMTLAESQRLLRFYESELNSYTYLTTP